VNQVCGALIKTTNMQENIFHSVLHFSTVLHLSIIENIVVAIHAKQQSRNWRGIIFPCFEMKHLLISLFCSLTLQEADLPCPNKTKNGADGKETAALLSRTSD